RNPTIPRNGGLETRHNDINSRLPTYDLRLTIYDSQERNPTLRRSGVPGYKRKTPGPAGGLVYLVSWFI
ncbi:MAG: hypothetical protein U1C33_06965, partial [Candidatus Cloacimonadaceae bacterium]|nr:hypothetical protein [Candidatus Cloacimonadaceae bacterium]